jgi:hypothetical protein
MTRTRWIIAACVTGIVAWCWLSFPTYTHRYRLTIAVEVDGQVHSGSSVIEVRYRFWPQFIAGLSGGSQYASNIGGQAVLVELGTRGALVASLLSYTDRAAVNAQYLALRALTPMPRMPEGGYVVTRDRLSDLSKAQGRVDLAPGNLPEFIWFRDITDPSTAKPVKAADFAAVIGAGARLSSAQLELTHDPIVVDIDKELPWYDALEKSQKTHGINTVQGKFQIAYNMFVGD